MVPHHVADQIVESLAVALKMDDLGGATRGWSCSGVPHGFLGAVEGLSYYPYRSLHVQGTLLSEVLPGRNGETLGRLYGGFAPEAALGGRGGDG